jgi:hypothetical protein
MRATASLLGIALAATLSTPSPATSQAAPGDAAEGPTRAFGVSAGLTSLHVRDDYLSPESYGGSLASAGLSYRRETSAVRQALELSFVTGRVSSAVQPCDVHEYVGSFSYAWLRSLRSGRGGFPLALLAGAGVSSYAMWTDFDASDPASGYTYFDRSWYWSHALDVHALAEYRFSERRRLSVRLTSPVVRLVSRPQNGHQFNPGNVKVMGNFLRAATGGTAFAIWNDPVLQWRLEYLQPIGPRVDLRIGYLFQNASADAPLPLRMYTNGVTASLVWRRGPVPR